MPRCNDQPVLAVITGLHQPLLTIWGGGGRPSMRFVPPQDQTLAAAFKAAAITFLTAWLIPGKRACKAGTRQGEARLRLVPNSRKNPADAWPPRSSVRAGRLGRLVPRPASRLGVSSNRVVLTPRAMAMRAIDQSLWTTSCLIASQSGSAFCDLSEICAASILPLSPRGRGWRSTGRARWCAR